MDGVHRIYLFVEPGDGEREFVIISDLPQEEVEREYEPWTLEEVLDVDGDATRFPCDRELKHQF